MAKKKQLEIAIAEVVDHLRMSGAFGPALAEVVHRKATAHAAREAGLKVNAKELQKVADAFRSSNGLHEARETHRWLVRNGLTVEALEDHLETNVLIAKFKGSLEKKTPRGKYLSSPEIAALVREMIYCDWVAKHL
jgi:hypothetical protein